MKPQHKVSIKLFLGVLITSELRMHLNSSVAWKHAAIDRQPDAPIETQYQDHKYLGIHLECDAAPLKHFHELYSKIQDSIARYCPEFNNDQLKPYILPQIFIS